MFLRTSNAVFFVHVAGLLACAVGGGPPRAGEGATPRRRPAAPLHAQTSMNGKRAKEDGFSSKPSSKMWDDSCTLPRKKAPPQRPFSRGENSTSYVVIACFVTITRVE